MDLQILLTNDDGIHAPGIRSLHRELVLAGYRVFVVAPLTVQSATSHSITYETPLMTEVVPMDLDFTTEVETGIAVNGRPADCTKLAVKRLWPERFGEGTGPDLVISGINAGANAGVNTLYSGTVAAAIEGAFLGVPAMAISLMIGDRNKTRFDIAARHALKAIQLLIAEGLPDPGTILNVNIPRTESETEFPEMMVGPINLHAHRDHYEARISPAGQPYYWAAGDGMQFYGTSGGSDVEIVSAGKISVTPMNYDLTDHSALDYYRERIKRITEQV